VEDGRVLVGFKVSVLSPLPLLVRATSVFFVIIYFDVVLAHVILHVELRRDDGFLFIGLPLGFGLLLGEVDVSLVKVYRGHRVSLFFVVVVLFVAVIPARVIEVIQVLDIFIHSFVLGLLLAFAIVLSVEVLIELDVGLLGLVVLLFAPLVVLLAERLLEGLVVAGVDAAVSQGLCQFVQALGSHALDTQVVIYINRCL